MGTYDRKWTGRNNELAQEGTDVAKLRRLVKFARRTGQAALGNRAAQRVRLLTKGSA